MFLKFIAQALAVASLTVMSLLSAPAVATEIGSNAWAVQAATLTAGPGTNYPSIAQSVTKGQSLEIARCSNRWCKLVNIEGWISIDNLSFGQGPNGPVSGPKFATAHGGDGEVCLHDQANYGGSSLCLSAGATARDLALWGWENRISSVSVGDGVSVKLCRDRNFTSYCSLIIKDTPRLERFLDNAVSSYRIW